MKVSVVMATFNGNKFLIEQLDSIKNQTRKPDEVLIFDDLSNDGTQELIIDYISTNHLKDSWHFEINENNKGCVRNFIEGAKRAEGDIVFYSDQDDIWDENKIEIMEKGFVEHPDMKACYCLRHYIDANNKEIKLKYQYMSNVKTRTNGFQKVSLNEVIRFNKSPGLCLAIKKELIIETSDMILNNNLTHDLPIGTVAAIYGGYYVLNQKLVYYRQHGNNISDPRYDVKSRLSRIDKQIDGRRIRLNQMEAVYTNYAVLLNDKDKKNLNRAINSTRDSIENLKNRSLLKLFLSIFDSNPMMNNWIAVNNFLVSIRTCNR